MRRTLRASQIGLRRHGGAGRGELPKSPRFPWSRAYPSDALLHTRKAFSCRGHSTAAWAEGNFQQRLTLPRAYRSAQRTETLSKKITDRSPPVRSPPGATLGTGHRARSRSWTTGGAAALRNARPGMARPGTVSQERDLVPSTPRGRFQPNGPAFCTGIRGACRPSGSCLLFFQVRSEPCVGCPTARRVLLPRGCALGSGAAPPRGHTAGRHRRRGTGAGEPLPASPEASVLLGGSRADLSTELNEYRSSVFRRMDCSHWGKREGAYVKTAILASLRFSSRFCSNLRLCRLTTWKSRV